MVGLVVMGCLARREDDVSRGTGNPAGHTGGDAGRQEMSPYISIAIGAKKRAGILEILLAVGNAADWV